MDTLEQTQATTQILGVTPFEGEGAVAGVTLRYGPVIIRAKLRKNNRGEVFLSFPSRKGKDEKWYDHAYIEDDGLRRQFESMALEAYRHRINNAA